MRRTLALLTCLALSVPALAACGESEGATEEATGASGIKVTGKIGTAPEVQWDGRMTMEESETTVLTEGDGETVEAGDRVMAHLWIGNGYTNEVALDSYAQKQPQVFAVDDKLVPGIREAVEGHTLGSRVQVAAPPEDAFGPDGNPSLGIGNHDSVLFVVDPLSTVLEAPAGKESPLPGWMPTLVEKDGVITGWDFDKAEQPDGELHVITLVEGTGPPVRKGSAIAAKYLGQVFKGKKPFDGNYDSPDPAVFTVGEGSLIKAWDRALVGVPVGSRVAIVVPPELGYGAKGNEQAGIKGTDTLYFVLDVLGST